ncbi:MAG: ASPIC/UnbV domain-containing protein, partial [Myxococcota bacterium]|nr:ASPIC/UnbV domain-containing protein [Myxococcota bacterium]
GLGSRVEVVLGDRVDVTEVHGVRAVGQSPARLHFGLGDVATVDLVRVVFPDGTEVRAEDVPTRRVIEVVHPEAI